MSSDFIVPQRLLADHAVSFADDSGAQPSTGSGRFLLDHEVAAAPCRYPCDIPHHTHQWPIEMFQQWQLDEQDVIDYYTRGSQ
jgi:hypothetical protein